MEILMANVASINHNDREGVRVQLSIAQADDGSYCIVSDIGEDCGPHFQSAQEAQDAIHELYGNDGAGVWGLEFADVIDAVQYAYQAGRVYAEQVACDRSNHQDGPGQFAPHQGLPDADYADLKARYGSVSPEIERAYRDGYNSFCA